MPLKYAINVPGGVIEIEAADPKTLLRDASLFQGLPMECPLDGSATRFFYTNIDGNEYWGVESTGECKYKYAFSSRKADGVPYQKREWTYYDPIGGWTFILWQDGRILDRPVPVANEKKTPPPNLKIPDFPHLQQRKAQPAPQPAPQPVAQPAPQPEECSEELKSQIIMAISDEHGVKADRIADMLEFYTGDVSGWDELSAAQGRHWLLLEQLYSDICVKIPDPGERFAKIEAYLSAVGAEKMEEMSFESLSVWRGKVAPELPM